MTKRINGSCLCGAVTFEMDDEFKTYNLCHCAQCQKISGSAHVSNLFTAPDNINWLSGEDMIKSYDVDGRSIRNAFCGQCGSNVPYVTHSKRFLLVPAGSLDDKPSIKPQQAIFWHERMDWYDEIGGIEKFDGFRD